MVVDVPAVVARNRESLAPMADALRALAGLRDENTQWLLEAAIALVQGGIAATPRADQAWLHYQGASYVLVEAVGPALRRPGEVSAATLVALNNPGSLRIDPMY